MTIRSFVVYAILVFIGLTILMSSDWITQTIHRERIANQTLLGHEHANAAFAGATDLFTQWFVETGIQRTSFELFVPDQGRLDASGAMANVGSPVWAWTADRIEAFWALIYQIMVRVYTVLQWWPFMILVLLPIIIDGILTRRINSYTFSLTSTHVHGIAVKSALGVIVIYLALMVLPVFVHPSWFPGIILLSGISTWLAMVHFAKRA